MNFDFLNNLFANNSYDDAKEQIAQQNALQQSTQDAAAPSAGPVPGGNPPVDTTPQQASAPVQPDLSLNNLPSGPVAPQQVPQQQAPQGPQAPVPPQAPAPQGQGPVAPQQPQQPPPPPLQTPTAVQPNTANNVYDAQMESGNNPNIGYHDLSKGTAYGTYGLTAAAYKDIQAANPQFAGVPITSLTPDQQAQANATYDGVLGQQLTNLGLQPTDANLRLAHFLGANGAASYLQTGAVSPQAAAANGGEAQVRQIAEGRLAGGNAPASGAVTAGMPGSPQAGPPDTQMDAAGWAQRFQTATQNPQMLANLRTDPNAPTWIKQAAADADYQNLKMNNDAQVAQQQLQQTIKSGNWTDLANQLKQNSDSGSIYKAMFYKQAGLNDLAQAEQQKLGAGRTWQPVTLADGTQGVVQVGADGAPIKGYTEQGEMTDDQMGQSIAAGGAGIGLGTNAKGATTSAKLYADQDGNTWTMTTVPGRAGAVWKNANTGRVSALAPVGLHPLSEVTIDQKVAATDLATMVKANRAASLVGAPLPYDQNALAQARNNAVSPVVAAQATQQAQGRPPMPPAPGTAPQQPIPYQSGNGALPGQGMVPVPPQPGQGPQGAQAPVAPGAPPVTGQVPQQDNSLAAKIARYELPMPPMSRNNLSDIAIRNQVMALNPNFDGTKYAVNQKMIQDYTSTKPGTAGGTMVNINTAVGHLEQFRQAAKDVGGSDSSAWNTMYQNMQKYGNAPEVKSKEAMAEFVAGEMVKAATGGQGGTEERAGLAKKLMAANTPQEWTKVIDEQEGLAHTRYAGLKNKYDSATGRKDFDQIAGLTPDVKQVFSRIENPSASSNPFAAELKRRQQQGQQ